MERRDLAYAAGIGVAAAVAVQMIRRARRRLAARRVDFFETLLVRLPADVAHRFWSHFENLAAFLGHVADIRGGAENEWRWSLRGEGASGPTWRAWVTENVPGKLIAWESAPGSPVLAKGVVNFEDVGDDVTRLSVRMSYGSAPGVPALPFRTLFGRTPGRRFRDDLARIATYLEAGHRGRRLAER